MQQTGSGMSPYCGCRADHQNPAPPWASQPFPIQPRPQAFAAANTLRHTGRTMTLTTWHGSGEHRTMQTQRHPGVPGPHSVGPDHRAGGTGWFARPAHPSASARCRSNPSGKRLKDPEQVPRKQKAPDAHDGTGGLRLPRSEPVQKRDAHTHTFMIDTRRVFRCASMASGPPSEP